MNKPIHEIMQQKPLYDGTSRVFEVSDSQLLRAVSVKTVKEKIPVFAIVEGQIKMLRDGLTDSERRMPGTEGDEMFAERLICLAENEFRLLDETYGIRVIPHSYSSTTHDGEVFITSLVPRVTGKTTFATDIDTMPFNKIEALVSGYCQYLIDKYNSAKQPTLWIDCGSKQYMWGTTVDNPSKELYLVDIDPFIYSEATTLMIDVANHRLQNLARNFGHDLPKDQRQRLLDIVKALPPLSLGYDPSEPCFITGDI